MTVYNIKWAVRETLSPGAEADGLRAGTSTVASGEVDKEAGSADEIRAELMKALRGGFPEHALGPTYNIDRTYDISITEV